MTRARLVVGNWKMNPPTIAGAVALARAVMSAAPAGDIGVAVAPTLVYSTQKREVSLRVDSLKVALELPDAIVQARVAA